MKIGFRIGRYIRRKILEWLLKDGIPYLRVGENTVDITGIDITLPSLTSDPSLAKGKIWFRGDLGQLRISPDGSNVKQVFPAYWNDIQGKPSTYPPSSHTHPRSQITDFWASPFWNNIPDKPSTFPPSAHGSSHNIGASDEIPDLATLRDDFDSHKSSKTDHVPSGKYICATSRSDQKPSWNDIPDKPSTFPPSSHTHSRSEITDFWSTPFWSKIPDKPSTFPPSAHNHFGDVLRPASLVYLGYTVDPSLEAGKVWFRSDLGQLRFSPDGVSAKLVYPPHWDDLIGKPRLIEYIGGEEIEADSQMVEHNVSPTLTKGKMLLIYGCFKNNSTAITHYYLYFNDVTDETYYTVMEISSGYVYPGGYSFFILYIIINPDGYPEAIGVSGVTRSDGSYPKVAPVQVRATFTVSEVYGIKFSSSQANGIGAGSYYYMWMFNTPV